MRSREIDVLRIPTGFRLKAQGCPALARKGGATLGWRSKKQQPQRGCASFSNLQWQDRERRTEAQPRWGPTRLIQAQRAKESSPPIYRWERITTQKQVPSGTKEDHCL